MLKGVVVIASTTSRVASAIARIAPIGKRSTGTVVLKADAITPGFGRVHNLDDLEIEVTVEGTTKVEYWTGNRER